MAQGRSIGTVYAELDLDKTRYTKAQQQLLKDATTTTLNIEQNFRNLGIKSAQEIELMRAKINNSFNMLTAKGKLTADELIRVERAKNDQLSRLNDLQFGRQKGMIDGIKSHWLAASAIIASAGAVAIKGWSMAKAGAEFEEQRGILDNLGAKYGMTADGIVADMERASDGLIARADLMGVALGGIAKGLRPDQLTNLADAARILGDSVGKDATTALRDLTEALESGRVRGLKGYMGAAIDLKSVFGDLEGKLTDTEKVQAMYNLTMIHATKLQADQSKEVDSAADRIERLEAKYKNLMTTAGLTAKAVAVGLLTSEGWVTGALAMSGLEMPEAPAGAVAPGINPDEAEHGRSMRLAIHSGNLEAQKAAIKAREDAKKAAEEAQKHGKELSKQARRDLIASLEAEEKEYEDMLRAEAAATDESLKERQRMEAEDWKGRMAGIEAETEGYEKGLIAAAEAEDEKKKVTIERMTAQRAMYEDMRGFEQDYYTTTTLMIDRQADEYQKLGLSEAAIAKWKEGEKIKALDAYVDKAGTLYQRLEKRTRKYAEDAGDLHKGLFNAIDAGAKDLERQMSDNFFDALTGNFQRVQFDWDSMWQAMARSAANSMAQMATTKFINPAISSGMGLLGSAAVSGLEWLSEAVGGFSGVLDWIGLSAGQYVVEKDKLAMLHQGEMVLPENYAQMLRDLMESSGGYAGPQPGFAMEPSDVLGPAMGGLIAETMGNSMSRGAGLGALGGLPGGFAGVAAGGMIGLGRGFIVGLIQSLGHIAGITDKGYIAGVQDAYGIDPSTGYNFAGANVSAGMGGFGEVGGFSGVNDSEIGGEWRLGGISSGPERGHVEMLHGTEAVVPLPDGRKIPVQMNGDGAAIPPVQLILQVDGREIGDVLFRLSRAGVKIIHQNGITAVG